MRVGTWVCERVGMRQSSHLPLETLLLPPTHLLLQHLLLPPMSTGGRLQLSPGPQQLLASLALPLLLQGGLAGNLLPLLLPERFCLDSNLGHFFFQVGELACESQSRTGKKRRMRQAQWREHGGTRGESLRRIER